jgi:threonine dehydratase
MQPLTIDDVRAAAIRIAPYAHRTPVLTCATIDALAGRQLFFKCEHLQKVGAFKFRGACNAVMALDDAQARHGVVTHSSGNHAQALALAAKLRGIAAHIVMPANASPVKQRAVEGYGAKVILCEANLEAREATATRVQRETGASLIHPYDNALVIAGQATATLEFLEQMPQLDAIITPVGGGGLLSGAAIVARDANTGLRVFAGEPAGADDAARSKAAGQFIAQESPKTIADGLLTSLGQLNWPIIRDHVERIFTVSEEEIIAAMRLAWERAKLMIEPSSAVPLAAVLGQEFRSLPELPRVGIILSGGNVDLDHLPW